MSRDPKAQTREVENMVEKWIQQTFTLSSPNIQINGLPYSEVFAQKTEYEPKDEQLQSRVEDLTNQVDEMLADVSGLRKEIPARVSKLAEETVRRETMGIEGLEWGGRDGMEGGVGKGKLSLVNFETIHTQYQSILESPQSLQKDLTHSLSRLQRAQSAVTTLTESDAQMDVDDSPSSSLPPSGSTSPQHSSEQLDTVTPRRARSGLLQKLQDR
ncbi:hypothetical protein HK097_005238 [Rhizophlyctis rosea]|uniref:Uncharacterized protein n=1 Tax=Rhizophlyctis rosea TaxID=64517 RepID=A0AAD5SGX9_9FUNG|nr:hypothetical protein HK097_005238 [Rhizophlyctis rosea]